MSKGRVRVVKVEDREALTLFVQEVRDEERLIPVENNPKGWLLVSRKVGPLFLSSGAAE
jgi:hypothetical protein